MAPAKKTSLTPLQTAVLVGQLIGILIALGLYAVDLGRRDATLTRIASDTQELRIVDSEGRDVPADAATMGEIAMRGNNVMLGYYLDDDATRRAAPLHRASAGSLPRSDQGRGLLDHRGAQPPQRRPRPQQRRPAGHPPAARSR